MQEGEPAPEAGGQIPGRLWSPEEPLLGARTQLFCQEATQERTRDGRGPSPAGGERYGPDVPP